MSLVIWVFILSVPIKGKPAFYHLNDVFINNQIFRFSENYFYQFVDIIKDRLNIAQEDSTKEVKRRF